MKLTLPRRSLSASAVASCIQRLGELPVDLTDGGEFRLGAGELVTQLEDLLFQALEADVMRRAVRGLVATCDGDPEELGQSALKGLNL